MYVHACVFTETPKNIYCTCTRINRTPNFRLQIRQKNVNTIHSTNQKSAYKSTP